MADRISSVMCKIINVLEYMAMLYCVAFVIFVLVAISENVLGHWEIMVVDF